ncbi:MAG TPA: MFS transporter [Anaerolineaceae bacterium]|nr:MFS transporter [Anaerolineaceae bacterium]
MKRIFASERRDLNLIALSLMVWSLGEGLFMIFQPIYLQELGANPIQIGFIISLSMVVIGLMHIPVGFISDRVSRKKLMVLSWIIGCIAALLMALSRNLLPFVMGMLLYNITGSVIAPMNSYISDCKGTWSDNQAFTFISASYMVGYLFGPIMGGFLAERIGLRLLYLIATAIFVISTWMIFKIKDQPVHPADGKPAARALFRNRTFVMACLLIFAVAFATYLPNPLTSNFLHNQRGISLQTLGIFGMVMSAGGILFNLFLGKMLAWPIYLIGQTAVIAFSVLLVKGRSELIFGLAYFMLGGFRVINAITSSVVRPLLHKAQVGLGFGIAETSKSLAFILAPVLAGYLYNRDPELIYQVAIGMGVVMLLFLLLVGRKTSFLHYKAESLDATDALPPGRA